MWSCMINPSGCALGFIIYHIKHERVYVSYNSSDQDSWLMYMIHDCPRVEKYQIYKITS